MAIDQSISPRKDCSTCAHSYPIPFPAAGGRFLKEYCGPKMREVPNRYLCSGYKRMTEEDRAERWTAKDGFAIPPNIEELDREDYVNRREAVIFFEGLYEVNPARRDGWRTEWEEQHASLPRSVLDKAKIPIDEILAFKGYPPLDNPYLGLYVIGVERSRALSKLFTGSDELHEYTYWHLSPVEGCRQVQRTDVWKAVDLP